MSEIASPFMFGDERNPFALSFREKLDALAYGVSDWQEVAGEVRALIIRLDRVNKGGGGTPAVPWGRITEVGPGGVNVQYQAESVIGGLTTSSLQTPLYRSFASTDVDFFPATLDARCLLWIDPQEENEDEAVKIFAVFEKPKVGACSPSAAASARAQVVAAASGRMSLSRMAMLA